MADKLDEQAIKKQMDNLRKAGLSPADLESAEKNMRAGGVIDVTARPEEKIDLRNDAKLITMRAIPTAGLEVIGGTVDFILNVPTWWDDRARRFDFAGKMARGWNDVMTAAGVPEAVTERERRMMEGFDTSTKAGIMGASLLSGLTKGGLTAMFGSVRGKIVPKTFGAAGAETGAATTTATKINDAARAVASQADDAARSATQSAKAPTPAPQPAAASPKTGVAVEQSSAADDAVREAEQIVRQHEAEMRAARAAEESARTSAKTAESVAGETTESGAEAISAAERLSRELNNTWVYLSRDKKLGLAQKLQIYTERGADDYLKLLTDRMRFEKISDPDMTAIRAAAHSKKISPETLQAFEEIYDINKLTLPFRSIERMKGRYNFVTEHPAYGTLYTAKAVGTTPVAPTIFAVRHPILAGAIVAADYHATDNYITGPVFRSQIAIPQMIVGGIGQVQRMLGSGSGDDAASQEENSNTSDADKALAIANGTAYVTTKISEGVIGGTVNLIESGGKQLGIPVDRDALKGKLTIAYSWVAPGAVTAADISSRSIIQAQTDTADGKTMAERTLDRFTRNYINDRTQDIQDIGQIASEASRSAPAQIVKDSAITAGKEAGQTIKHETETPELLASLQSRATQIADATGKAIKDGVPGAAAAVTAGGAVVASLTETGTKALNGAKDSAAEILQKTQDELRAAREKAAEQALAFEQQLKDQKDRFDKNSADLKEKLQAEWDDKVKTLKEETTQQVASLQKDLADMKDAAAKKVIDIKENAGKIAMAGIFPDLTEAFGKAKDWFKEPGNLLTAGLAFGAALLVGNMMFGGSGKDAAPAPAASSGNGGMGMMGNVLGLALLAAAAYVLYNAVTNHDGKEPQTAQAYTQRNQPGMAPYTPG